MAQVNRPRRSVLYMPASNARALEKGRSLAADALIFDLEDAVAPAAKVEARAQLIAAVREGGYGKREIILRVNGLDSAWGYDDLVALANVGADAILLPKVENASMVREAEAILVAHGAAVDLRLMCMMETPLGILNVKEIASATPRLGALVMGTSDLAKDLRCAHTVDRAPMLASLSMCVLAARAYDLAVLDGVYLDLNDEVGFEAACLQGVELGFDGKTLIHPKQIEAANEAFAPSEGEVDYAKKVIAAHAAAVAKGEGVVLLDGRLIENLHVAAAQDLCDKAEMILGMG